MLQVNAHAREGLRLMEEQWIAKQSTIWKKDGPAPSQGEATVQMSGLKSATFSQPTSWVQPSLDAQTVDQSQGDKLASQFAQLGATSSRRPAPRKRRRQQQEGF